MSYYGQQQPPPPPQGYYPPPGGQYPPPQQMQYAPPQEQSQSKDRGCLTTCLLTMCCCFLCEEACECCFEIPLPPAIPAFDDLSPQRIRVGLSRDLPPHRLDAHYLTNQAYEPVYLAPNTHSSTYSLLQAGGEALPADDVLLHPPFTDPRTRLFVARNALRDYQAKLTAAADAYHARLRDWRSQRRQWEAALLVALGRRTPEEMAALIRSEVVKDKYRPWFVGMVAPTDGGYEFTSPVALCDGPVVASAVRARLDHVARTISALTDRLRLLAGGGRYFVVDEFGEEYELCPENAALERAAFADWAVERSMHWLWAVREGMVPEVDGLVRDLGAERDEEDDCDYVPWRPRRGGLFVAGGQEQPWGEPAYCFQVEVQRAGRPSNALFDEEIRDLLYCVEEWYFTALDERERAIVQGMELRFWPMPAGLYSNAGETLGFENPFGD
ncbi:hypothetical protein ASPACDRAFT_47487 [Aspergillus aculeatus ATCC 16872]|uniref:Cysteine-rich transmembrane CYSTM domain-containing protein n=1 Tax=Aspergillus aculeatus (strain ATCC 16872 / CBS 172.66 / WB 5094) TaxID=690307 RepID=A0A1L9WHK8_ASPA1|nr:uncharacterized protein ASPACDRAFT_47487 [Aspergillus aculeatus ATCC 16872]OJJ95597.1 hypothetical protein ASPACDRAFT_47487 [Aspergillus aculeatus ATCC 16872]